MITIEPIIYTAPQVMPTGDKLVDNFFKNVLTNVSVPFFAGYIPHPKRMRELKSAIEAEIREIKKITKNSRPFENAEKLLKNRLIYLEETCIHYEIALRGYPQRVDMSMLADYNLFPKMGVTDTESSGMKIACSKDNRFSDIETRFEPNLPADLAVHYAKVVEHLSSYHTSETKGNVFISSRPVGLMPEKVKKNLVTAEKSGIFSKIFIVFEAKWQVFAEVEVDDDPLIIGQVPGAKNLYFLIDKYNPTSYEEHLLSKYSMNPLY